MFWIWVGPKRHLFCKKNHYRFRAPEVKAISPSNWWGYRRKWKLSHFYTSSNLCHCQNLPNVGQTDRCYCCLGFFSWNHFPFWPLTFENLLTKKKDILAEWMYWKTRVKVIFALFQLSDFISQFLHIFFAYLGKSKEISFFPPDGVWLIFCKISSKCTKWIWLDLASSLLRSDISQPQSLSGLEGWYLKTKLFHFLGLVNFKFF